MRGSTPPDVRTSLHESGLVASCASAPATFMRTASDDELSSATRRSTALRRENSAVFSGSVAVFQMAPVAPSSSSLRGCVRERGGETENRNRS